VHQSNWVVTTAAAKNEGVSGVGALKKEGEGFFDGTMKQKKTKEKRSAALSGEEESSFWLFLHDANITPGSGKKRPKDRTAKTDNQEGSIIDWGLTNLVQALGGRCPS